MQRDIGLAEEPSHMDYAGEQSGSDDLSGDFLHDGRTVGVPGDEIATTVSAWLAELGTIVHWLRTLPELHALATGPQPMPSVSTYPAPIPRRDVATGD